MRGVFLKKYSVFTALVCCVPIQSAAAVSVVLGDIPGVLSSENRAVVVLEQDVTTASSEKLVVTVTEVQLTDEHNRKKKPYKIRARPGRIAATERRTKGDLEINVRYGE